MIEESAEEKMIWDVVDNLPSLPIVVTKVLEVTDDPESSAQHLLQAILPDQSMCVAILKIANSALFGLPRKVSSIERAIMVLGFNEVRNIVLGRAVVNSFSSIPAKHRYSINQFWEHSFLCGLAARNMAEGLGLSSGDFFVSGLIHDLGKLAMFLALGEKYDTATWMLGGGRIENYQQEKKQFGFDHPYVGAKLLQKWDFPKNLILAVAYHHNPAGCEKGRGYPLIIQLADFYAFLINHPHLLKDTNHEDLICSFLPQLKEQWLELKLPWDPFTLETWYSWLKIEARHGSQVMSLLASQR